MQRELEIKALLQEVFEQAGDDVDFGKVTCLEGDTDSKVRQVKALSEELDVLSRSQGHPLPGNGQGGINSVSKMMGWRQGHWGSVFQRELQGSLTPSGTVTVPSLTSGVVPIPDRPARLIDLIPVEKLEDSDQYAYLLEVSREHKAAETAKGALKPTSVYSVKKVEGSAKTIAHISEPVARQDLEDARLLGSYMDGSMRAGVLQRLEEAILAGTGEEGQLTGLGSTEDVQQQNWAEDILATARKALTKLEDKDIPGGAFVLSTAAWETIELLQEADGDYISRGEGLPVDRLKKQLWGQPVVVTTALTGKVGYLVDFAGSTKMWERTTVRVDWSEAPEGSVEGKAAFASNELCFRGEGRFGFAVTRPNGVVQFATAV